MGLRSWCLATLIVCSGCGAPVITNRPADGGGDDGSGDAWALQPKDTNPFVLNAADAGLAGPDAGPNCRRSVNLTAVSIARPVPFDVVIVADNSDSLSWSRDSLSAGLRNLLARVHGHEARFFVLTGTQYGASSQTALSPFTGKELVTWRDSVTRAPYAHPMTDYVHSCFDPKGATIPCPGAGGTTLFTLKGTWQFRLPPPVAAITPAMTDAQVAAQQKSIADAILALGGGGAQQEQPVCTLSRYLTQNPAALPKNVVFVVITDEDDTSPPSACLAGYEAKRVATMPEHYDFCNVGCDKFTYTATRPAFDEATKFTCIPVDDTGKAHPERAFEKTKSVDLGGACRVPAGSACTAAQVTDARTVCGPGHEVSNCRTTCARSDSVMLACNLDRPNAALDLCTKPFDEGGKRYTNFIDYCRQTYNAEGWGDCSYAGWKRSGMTFVSEPESVTPLVRANDTAGMIAAFKSDADRLFGKTNYSVETIILDPSFACPLHPGQSYASNLRALATSAADVFALCQDYAPALRRIEGFAEYLLQSDFALDLSVYEDVDSVLVTNRAGMQRTIGKAGYRYDRATKTLHFFPGNLNAQDERLAVNVARYCEPIVK